MPSIHDFCTSGLQFGSKSGYLSNIFDINRDGSKVISFSVGIHICLGRELAKLETRVALNAIKNRFPNIRLLNDGERVGPFLFWGRKKLPVTHK